MGRNRKYICIIDTETANTLSNNDMSDVLVYDLGYIITDVVGKIYTAKSFVNRDIFLYERDLMKSAYYADKLPQYYADIDSGARTLAKWRDIRYTLLDDMAQYNVKTLCAHNARFDANALNRTESYLTHGRNRYFFPYDSGITWYDTMRMAQSLILKRPTYKKFCEANGFVTMTGRPRSTAEILYRYITKNPNFTESHTGLEDVMIEREILVYCYKQHKSMKKECFPPREKVPMTEWQRAYYKSLRAKPTIRTKES